MARLRWSDREPQDRPAPVDWRCASLIMATLFLNFSFCMSYGLDLCCFGPLVVHAGVLWAGVLLVTALFFLGPAMAVQAAGRRVFGVIQNSFGSFPTLVLRLCVVVFLAVWIAKLLAVPTLWALARIPGREPSSTETSLIASVLLAFLFFTGFQSTRTSASLALFTNKLGLAILIAAFIRVHDGWAAVPAGFPTAGQPRVIEQFWYGLSRLAFYVAPLALLAADFCFRSRRRRDTPSPPASNRKPTPPDALTVDHDNGSG